MLIAALAPPPVLKLTPENLDTVAADYIAYGKGDGPVLKQADLWSAEEKKKQERKTVLFALAFIAIFSVLAARGKI